MGVVSDVNQKVGRAPGARGALLQRFTYRYAWFSTSGFTCPIHGNDGNVDKSGVGAKG
jgi:hypothetical protein